MMGDPRIETPKTTDLLRKLLSAANAPLPWTEGEDRAVYDANGKFVLQVDPDRKRPNKKSQAIAALLVTSVNIFGGFRT